MLESFIEKIKQNPFLAMFICCALPFVAIFAFSSLGLLGILGKYGVYALILLCPIAHIWMMRGMFQAPEDSGGQERTKEIEHK